MKRSAIYQALGRDTFGLDPAGYHSARPPYPEWIYEELCIGCGLRQDTATFEIGPGTGIATSRLLALGANPLVAIEPNNSLADFLGKSLASPALRVLRSSFEEAAFSPGSFDLGFCATAFHWLHENSALIKVSEFLRSGGWWVMVWNEFGDPDRDDPYHEATKLLLNGPSGSLKGEREIPFGQDKHARLAALEQTHAFDRLEYLTSAWSLILDPGQVVNLYATYSNINIRPDREAILAELHRIAVDEFQGRVTRNMVKSFYKARRI